MKNDENQPGNLSERDLALEARIVAWVAGEAAPFEVAELNRLVAEQPELGVFKRRIEAVHGLVAEAVRADTTPLQLSPERRKKLLATLGVPVPPPKTSSKETASVLAFPLFHHRTQWLKGLSVACSVLLVFLILKVTLLSRNEFALKEAYREQDEVTAKVTSEAQARRIAPGSISYFSAAPKIVAPSGAVAVSLPQVPTKFLEDSLRTGEGAATPLSAPVNEVPVQMEPFVVEDSEAAQSYQASSTLAGTRIRTDLGNIGSGGFLDSRTPSQSVDSLRPNRDSNRTSLPLSRTKAIEDSSSLAGNVNPSAPSATRKTTAERPHASDTFLWVDRVGPQTDSGEARKRAKTNLKDVASAINVVTQQFIDDTNSHNSKDLLKYTRNTEVAGLQGNFSGKPQDGERLRASQTANIAGGVFYSDKVLTDPTIFKSHQNSLDGSLPASQPINPGPVSDDKVEAQKKKAAAPPLTAELNAAVEPVSTFSLHVSDASFVLAQAALARGQRPDPDSIRPEEFYNAFDYGDPAPAMAEQISCRVEQSAHPELQQRNLVRIAMRVPATGRGVGQPLRLTVLLDTSGSMERDDRAAAVHRAMEVLVSLLGPSDRVTLIGFSRTPRLLAESIPGDQAKPLLQIMARTPAEGGTNLEEALKLASELAHRQQLPNAQNRIVLLTDGAANLGDADPAKLATAIETLRQEGIAFDACGVGTDGIDDTMLEALTRHGNGRYSILSTPESADVNFARQLAGAFRPAAKNVKVQVRFNPARVAHYRLIGFEKHRLKEEDFRNDQVDAAELAADEAAVALYQVEALPQGEGEVGEVYVRFRDTATGNMVERSWTLPYDAHAAAFDRATPTMQLAGTSALVAEALRGAPIRLDDLVGPVNALRGHYAHEARVEQLATMFDQLRRMDGPAK